MTQPVPPEPIPNATTYSTQDTEHLRLLRIFWYIWAGITGFFSCIFIVHIVMGIVFVVSPPTSSTGGPVPPFLGWMFIAMGSCFMLFGWTIAVLSIFVANSLGRRRRHMFCLIVSGIACLNVPLGTILGVFTMIVLLRPTVKTLFQRAA